jgi:hypothetical protein
MYFCYQLQLVKNKLMMMLLLLKLISLELKEEFKNKYQIFNYINNIKIKVYQIAIYNFNN